MSLQHILENVDNPVFKIMVNYEITCEQSPIVGEGYTGHFYMGEIKNKETGEVYEVAVKRSRFESGVESIFKNENHIYSVIFPLLNKFQKDRHIEKPFDNVPQYFGGSSQQGKEYVAMLNLKARGYILYDKTKYLDNIHLDYIFTIYGKFHALCFMFKKKNPEKHSDMLDNLTNVFASKEVENLSRPIKNSLCGAINAMDEVRDKELYTKCQDLLKNIGDKFVHSAKYNGKYSCLNHGGCCSNNMLFKYDDWGKIENMKLVDFQLCRETTPIHDLSYLFYSGASPEDFNNLDSYLEVYHRSFCDFVEEMGGIPEQLLPISVLKKEWMENALWGILMSIYLWEIKLSPKDKISEIIGDNDMPAQERTRRWKIIIKDVHETVSFKEKTTPILLHAVKNDII